MIKLDVFKNGKKHAVTFSYDDGKKFDERLIDIFNKHGIKGTFHLNSGRFGAEGFVDDINVYAGHEVSCHGVVHASLAYTPLSSIPNEIMVDRAYWEKLVGTPVRGLSYANGSYNDEVVTALKTCGIVYSRTTLATYNFNIPDDFLKWHPTCHHKEAAEMVDKFLKMMETPWYSGKLLYIWGHSYEFDTQNNWELIEDVCKKIAGDDRVWYATNIEIYEYITAAKRLVISADNKIVYNPSAISVWFTADGSIYEVKPGETLYID